MLFIAEELTGEVDSPFTRALVVATQLKVLGILAESPKFRGAPEQIELIFKDVIWALGLTPTVTVTV